MKAANILQIYINIFIFKKNVQLFTVYSSVFALQLKNQRAASSSGEAASIAKGKLDSGLCSEHRLMNVQTSVSVNVQFHR